MGIYIIFIQNSWSAEQAETGPSKPSKENDDTIHRVVNANNASGNFYNCLSSIPKKRGFKMSSRNIVTLPPKTDEIQDSMLNKNIYNMMKIMSKLETLHLINQQILSVEEMLKA